MAPVTPSFVGSWNVENQSGNSLTVGTVSIHLDGSNYEGALNIPNAGDQLMTGTCTTLVDNYGSDVIGVLYAGTWTGQNASGPFSLLLTSNGPDSFAGFWSQAGSPTAFAWAGQRTKS